MLPNVIFLNVGTNDCNLNVDTGNAGKRIKTVIDDILASLPDVVLIWSTLLPSRDKNSCAQDVSRQYRDLYTASYKNQQRVQLGDVNSFLTLADIGPDGIHPNDYGYKKFASVFWDAFRKAEKIVKPPGSTAGIEDGAVIGSAKTCTKVAGKSRGPVQTQKGSGHDDARYVHSSKSQGPLVSARIQKAYDKTLDDDVPSHMFFAQVINPGGVGPEEALDDWIRVLHGLDGKNTYFVRQNNGKGSFGSSMQIDVDQNCDGGPSESAFLCYLPRFLALTLSTQ